MVQLTPKGKYSIAAALLGLFSFVLPWIAFTISNGVAYRTNGESPATLLSDLVTAPRVTPTTDSAILAWERAAEAGYGVWVVGAVMFLVACFVTLVQAFESYRWGGFWMLLGALVSTGGIVGMSAQFTTDAGYTATVGPSVGIGLAVIASLVALVPAFKVDPRDRWVRDPQDRGWVRMAAPPLFSSPSSGYVVPQPTSPPPGPATTPRTEGTGQAIPPPSAAGPPVTERRFCPECGAWYLAGEAACPRDGSPLKPVRESAPG